MIDIDTNPLYYAAAGGVILGIATSINYCVRGKVTGMSGIVDSISSFKTQQFPQKFSILGGMLVISAIFFNIFEYGTINNLTPFGPQNLITTHTSYVGYAVAGLLVGFGTKMSNGCTSGHGLCGLPRFSIRSFVAVCVFLTTAIVVATIGSYQTLGPFTDEQLNPQIQYNHMYSANIFMVLGAILPVAGCIIKFRLKNNKQSSKQIIIDQSITWIVGILFGCGLLISGMVRRINIIKFLAIHQGWNPSLLFVLGCGVGVNLLTFTYIIKVKKVSLRGKELFNPSNKKIDWKLVTGAACFGVGWGIGGLCPGPAIMQFSVFTLQIQLVWFGCLLVGQFLARTLDKHLLKKQLAKKQQKNTIEPAKVEPNKKSNQQLLVQQTSELISND